jgi:hypothetical protein
VAGAVGGIEALSSTFCVTSSTSGVEGIGVLFSVTGGLTRSVGSSAITLALSLLLTLALSLLFSGALEGVLLSLGEESIPILTSIKERSKKESVLYKNSFS